MLAILQAPFLQQEAASSQPWEQLVTDGHVRAARVRMIAPFIIGIGIFTVMAGVYGLLMETSNRSLPSMREILQKRMHDFKAPITQPFQSLSNVPSMTMEQMKDIPPASELPKVIEMLKASLQANESYPKELSEIIKEVDPSTFWQGEWPAARVGTDHDRTVDSPLAAIHDNWCGLKACYHRRHRLSPERDLNYYM